MKRRDLLGLGGLTLVGVTLLPASARAEIPKRGGTITLRLWDPPHFDPYLQVSYKTHIVYSFTHSRLVKHRAGPAVVPGTFAIEGDLAESWSQPDETTYVFKLRRGVRWQPKAPVNGRELTADEGALCVVPRRARQPDGRMHRGEGMCREVRRPAEPRGDRRNGPVDARFVPAQCRHDAGAQPGLLRGGPALHRQGRDLRGRGQCLAHGRIPRRQVRHRLGESRDDQSQ